MHLCLGGLGANNSQTTGDSRVLEKPSGWDRYWRDCGAASWDWWDWKVQASYWRDCGTWRLAAVKAMQGIHGLPDVASPNSHDIGSLISQVATQGWTIHDCPEFPAGSEPLLGQLWTW